MRRKKLRARYSWNRRHDKCRGTGWITVTAYSQIGGRPMTAVTRCECFFKISAEPQPKKKHHSGHDGKARGAGKD